MDKKINYILIGCGVIGAIIILAGSYMLYRMNPESDVVQVENIQPPVSAEVPPAVVITGDSYGGVVASIIDEKIILTKDDGSTEEFLKTDFSNIYDNRLRDAMNPVTFQDIEEGMKVRVSITTNQSDMTAVKSLVIF